MSNITITRSDTAPPFLEYAGQDSFFGGSPPLSLAIGK